MDCPAPGMSRTQYRLINRAYARLFTAGMNGCKWNIGDFAVKWE